VGLVEGVDVGLGLFVCAFLAAGSVLGEYTGVLSRRRTEEDGVYGYGLPVVEPDLVINAKEGRLRFGRLRYGSVSKHVKTLYHCSSHQNSWDLWMFIPLKMVLIGIDPYPDVDQQLIALDLLGKLKA